MRLIYTDGRLISDLTDLKTASEVRTAPIEYSASISAEAARTLKTGRAPYYRAEDGDQRFTLTIDKMESTTISGTIRRR
mgnify:CR=1 FL=1